LAEPNEQVAADPSAATDHPYVERAVSSRVLHRGRYLTFRVDTVERPDGSRAERDICGHPGAVAVLAIDDQDRVLLVRQYRLAAGELLLELPAGTLDVDPATGAVESPDRAAPRELEEEAGVVADSWRHLGSFWTAPGFATEEMHLYLATGLRTVREGILGEDEDERLELQRLPWREAVRLAETGAIRDAKSIVGLFWLARLKDSDHEG
jgi:nudix-type nucleoside diphosphatase (YffH/AdpP family)